MFLTFVTCHTKSDLITIKETLCLTAQEEVGGYLAPPYPMNHIRDDSTQSLQQMPITVIHLKIEKMHKVYPTIPNAGILM